MVTPVNHNPSRVTHKLGTETTNVNYESGRINNGPTYELAATSKKKKLRQYKDRLCEFMQRNDTNR
jgi:hypothetical protein